MKYWLVEDKSDAEAPIPTTAPATMAQETGEKWAQSECTAANGKQ